MTETSGKTADPRKLMLWIRIQAVIMALILVINMLRTKVKAKKMSKEAQQQMSKLMGNDDTPVL